MGWDDIIGQEQAKRALIIAATGAHNLLMVGPPGTGKSLLASRLLALLPDMTEEEALEVAAIHSVKGEKLKAEQFLQRHLRSPHHTSSAVALTAWRLKPRSRRDIACPSRYFISGRTTRIWTQSARCAA